MAELGEDRRELPVSATFVVAADRTSTYAYIDADYCKRPEPAELLAQLAKLAPVRAAKIA